MAKRGTPFEEAESPPRSMRAYANGDLLDDGTLAGLAGNGLMEIRFRSKPFMTMTGKGMRMPVQDQPAGVLLLAAYC